MLAQVPDGGVTSPKGFKAAGYTAGFKASGLPDLALVTTHDNEPVSAAAVFTKNLLRAAPVTLSERHMEKSSHQIAAVLLNAGQANAATGDAGMQDAVTSATHLANALSIKPENIFICSTGVIGRQIDMQKMIDAIPHLTAKMADSVEAATDAASAIMTTDLARKQVAYEDNIDGKLVTVGGMCKGSGMIHPDMATMLGVVTCDADVLPSIWQPMLKRAIDKSFNAITVDGDSSTNDVVCAMAGGQSGVSITTEGTSQAVQLEALMTKTCVHLAKSIARDGEGATILLQVNVKGASSDKDAMEIAKSVASSSLVKSAIFGRDPNWGRIACAAGYANVSFDVADLKISMGDHVLMENGNPLQYDEKLASKYMQDKANASEDGYLSDKDTIVVSLEVGAGQGCATAWGCDLSYKYVEINAEYTT